MTDKIRSARAFLAEPWVGMLGVAAPARAPLVVPVWYALDAGGRPWFVTPKTSFKSRLIEASGRITLTAQNDRRPYAYVSVEGTALMQTAAFEDIQEMSARYLGPKAGAEYAARMREAMDGNTRWRVTLEPERWSTYGLDD